MKTKEYKEGWNACNAGESIFKSPYFFASPRHTDWKDGHKDCQDQWNNGDISIPKSFSVGEVKATESVLDIL